MNHKILKYLFKHLTVLACLSTTALYAAGDLPTKFSNQGGIKNTRHNLTQNTLPNNGGGNMNSSRNDYGQVCVYCHTPHGANTTVNLPLWNRTINANTYTTYDTLNTSTLTSDVAQPGINSLSCLSCHDGTLAVDSIINMPGSNGYSASQQTTQSDAFLNQWATVFGGNATSTHAGLSADGTGCLACHSTTALAVIGGTATDFRLFAIGTDLTNDHPVGIAMPATGAGTDFNTPTATLASISWFGNDADSRPDSNEIRFYNTGSGPRVECASCHDPHGVSPTGIGGTINASFLRINNAGSAVCLTCHVK